MATTEVLPRLRDLPDRMQSLIRSGTEKYLNPMDFVLSLAPKEFSEDDFIAKASSYLNVARSKEIMPEGMSIPVAMGKMKVSYQDWLEFGEVFKIVMPQAEKRMKQLAIERFGEEGLDLALFDDSEREEIAMAYYAEAYSILLQHHRAALTDILHSQLSRARYDPIGRVDSYIDLTGHVNINTNDTIDDFVSQPFEWIRQQQDMSRKMKMKRFNKLLIGDDVAIALQNSPKFQAVVNMNSQTKNMIDTTQEGNLNLNLDGATYLWRVNGIDIYNISSWVYIDENTPKQTFNEKSAVFLADGALKRYYAPIYEGREKYASDFNFIDYEKDGVIGVEYKAKGYATIADVDAVSINILS